MATPPPTETSIGPHRQSAGAGTTLPAQIPQHGPIMSFGQEALRHAQTLPLASTTPMLASTNQPQTAPEPAPGPQPTQAVQVAEPAAGGPLFCARSSFKHTTLQQAPSVHAVTRASTITCPMQHMSAAPAHMQPQVGQGETTVPIPAHNIHGGLMTSHVHNGNRVKALSHHFHGSITLNKGGGRPPGACSHYQYTTKLPETPGRVPTNVPA